MQLGLGLFALSVFAVATGLEAGLVVPGLWLLLFLSVAVDCAISLRPAPVIEVEGPSEVDVGAQSVLLLRSANMPEQVSGSLAWGEGLSGDTALEMGAETSVTLRGLTRGTWPLPTLYLRWPSRLGLVEQVAKVPLAREIKVLPDLRALRSGEVDTRLREVLGGGKPVGRSGEGAEFHQLREYQAGMEPKLIDWKRSARVGALVARELQTERNQNLILAMDTGYLMEERLNGISRFDHSLAAALALGWGSAQLGDRTGLFAFDAVPRLYVPPEPGKRAFEMLRQQTAQLQPRAQETNFTLGMTSLLNRLRRRALVVVFSEFLDTTSAELMVETLTLLVRRHAVVFVTLSPEERPAFQHSDGMLALAEAVAEADQLTERETVLARLRHTGISVLDTTPEMLSGKLLSVYLDLKAREVV
ncbi:MAG: DUF58 domain-containing protein [Pseudomonadota bacterium]